MHRIELSPWMSDEESNSKEIFRVSNQIGNIENKLNKIGLNILSEVDDETLLNNIFVVISHWTKNTYVGKRKNKTIRDAYQSFFTNLYKFLYFFKHNNCEYYSDLAKESLYQGKLYRYLGHGNSYDNIQSKIIPEYNDIYVSWSKNPQNIYFEQKLYGTITILTCNVSEPFWAIDLKRLGAVCEGEDEVVFPTIRETVEDITYIER